MAEDDDSRSSISTNSSESSIYSDSSTSWSNYILQLLAIGLAVLFGFYTAISYPLAKDSLQQAEIANQLSLLSFCPAQAENSTWPVSCSDVLKNFNLTAVAKVLSPPPASPGSTKGRGGLSSSQKIGLGVGLGFGLPAATVVTATFFIRAAWVSLNRLVIFSPITQHAVHSNCVFQNILLIIFGLSRRRRSLEIVEERSPPETLPK
jgi:hypothetical protein